MAIMVLSVQVRNELRAVREEPGDNVYWNVTQLELEVVRLEAEARLALFQPSAELTDLRQRYDLFYSRATIMNEGKTFERLGLVEAVRPLKERLQTFLDVTTPLIDGPDEGLRGALPQMVVSIGDLVHDIRTMSIRVIEANGDLQDQRRAALGDALQKIALASTALVALLVLLIVVVLTLNRHAERRRHEIQRITSRLEATVGTSLDPIIVAGMDGRVMDFNPAAERVFGYSRDEAVGRSLGELIVPAKHRAAHDAGMDRMRRTGVKHVVDAGRIRITAVRKSGEEFPVELSIASDDGPLGMIFIAYLRDTSDQDRAEAALVAARDEAQAADRMKSNFIAVMSHEMRTPLNGVIGALEIVARTKLDARQERFVRLATASAQQLLRHVNDVLDLSRIDAGFAEIGDDRFDLSALIATMVDQLRPAASKKEIQIETHLLSVFPPLRGDPFRLGQILQNFVMNAIKFTERGQITVEAEVESRAGNEVEIELRVIDTGIGISEEDQERVFDDFVMVDPSYGRTGSGTGLGLAIVRRLAHAMGGEVGVESELGEGSCFWLRVKLAVAGAGEAPPAEKAPAAAIPAPDPSRALEVLVVEDNETNRVVVSEMLDHLGHRTTLAEDGQEGVAKASARRFDVILMDLSMPKMDGWAAIAAIRQEGASKDSRILALTAHARPQGIDRMAEALFDGWLPKPLSITVLDAALRAKSRATPPQPVTPDVTAAEPLLDGDRLAELRQLMAQGKHGRLLASFQAQMDRIVADIAASSADRALQELAAVSHEGAGAAAMIGAVRLHRLLAAIEAACKTADRSKLNRLALDLPALWQETLRQLDAVSAAAPR